MTKNWNQGVGSCLEGELHGKMNFTYVLGFGLVSGVVKVFPVSSLSLARKSTMHDAAWWRMGISNWSRDLSSRSVVHMSGRRLRREDTWPIWDPISPSGRVVLVDFEILKFPEDRHHAVKPMVAINPKASVSVLPSLYDCGSLAATLSTLSRDSGQLEPSSLIRISNI